MFGLTTLALLLLSVAWACWSKQLLVALPVYMSTVMRAKAKAALDVIVSTSAPLPPTLQVWHAWLISNPVPLVCAAWHVQELLRESVRVTVPVNQNISTTTSCPAVTLPVVHVRVAALPPVGPEKQLAGVRAQFAALIKHGQRISSKISFFIAICHN